MPCSVQTRSNFSARKPTKFGIADQLLPATIALVHHSGRKPFFSALWTVVVAIWTLAMIVRLFHASTGIAHLSESQWLSIALWTLTAWIVTATFLLIWEGRRPGGYPGDVQVKKQIVWFALQTALIIGGVMALSADHARILP